MPKLTREQRNALRRELGEVSSLCRDRLTEERQAAMRLPPILARAQRRIDSIERAAHNRYARKRERVDEAIRQAQRDLLFAVSPEHALLIVRRVKRVVDATVRRGSAKRA